MPEVEVVTNSNSRGKVFWGGFLVGLLFSLIAVIVFWLLGVINFGGSSAAEDTANNTANESNFDNAAFNATDIDSNDNNTVNEPTNAPEEVTKDDKAAAYYKSAVTAKDVDEGANPIGETATFSKDDDRFYVILSLDPSIPKGTEVGVEWYLDDTVLSEYSTDVDAGQTLVYFFQTNPGTPGDYAAVLNIDGVTVDEIQFQVQ